MLTAGVLREMVRTLSLEVDPASIAGRGKSQRARDAFWVAVNRAAVEAIAVSNWPRLARLYEAQSEVLRAEGRPFIDMLARSFTADLSAIETETVMIIGNCCGTCRRDDRTIATTDDERRLARLPHVDCERGRCTCFYQHGSAW
jgi:hypothetical protein